MGEIDRSYPSSGRGKESGTYRNNGSISRKKYEKNVYGYGNDVEEPLPYSVAFRLRLLVCTVFFLFFLFAGEKMIPEESMDRVYSALNSSMSEEGVEECISLVTNP